MPAHPDPTFHASAKLAMQAPPEKLAYTVMLSPGGVTPTWIGAARGLEGPLNFRPRWRLATSGTLRLVGREACGGM